MLNVITWFVDRVIMDTLMFCPSVEVFLFSFDFYKNLKILFG